MCGSRACDPRPGEVRTGGYPGHLPRHREFEGNVSYVTGKPKGRGRDRDCYVDRDTERDRDG